MKKFTFYSFLLLFVLSAFSSIAEKGTGKNQVTIAPFFTETFSANFPGSWQNNDSASTLAKWKYTTSGNSTGFDALDGTGTTAADGYMIFDSDEIFGTPGDAWMITSAINCTGKSNVHLTFNEFFKKDLDNVGEVYVSTNGTTWSSVIYSAGALLGNGGDATANPHAVDLDISSIADNQAMVHVAFRYLGSSGYYWMVDDVSLFEASSLDGGVTRILAPLTTCGSLTSTETVSVRIKNMGLTALVNTPVSYLLDGTYTVGPEIVSTTINPGDSIIYNFTGKANLSAAGPHTIAASTSVIGDADASNDGSTSMFHIGPHSLVYTQGFEIPTEDVSGWFFADANLDGTTWMPSGAGPRTGSVCAEFTHDLPTNTADDWLFSPCLDMNDASYSYLCTYWVSTFSSFTDANLEVVLLSAQDPSAVVQVIDPVMTISNETYQMNGTPFSIPSADIYYIGWHVTNTSNNTNIKIDDINVSFYIKTPPVSENANAIVYPNPNDGTFSISNLKSFNGTVLVSVLDMTGRSVYEQSVNGLDKINLNLAGQTAGVYTVRIGNDVQVLNKLITITE